MKKCRQKTRSRLRRRKIELAASAPELLSKPRYMHSLYIKAFRVIMDSSFTHKGFRTAIFKFPKNVCQNGKKISKITLLSWRAENSWAA